MRRGDDDETAATGDHLFELRIVAITEPLEALLEPPLEAGEGMLRRFRFVLSAVRRRVRVVSLQNILRHGRHQRVRQDKGGQHREDDRFCHRREHPAGDAAEMEQRDPDDRDGERGDERRENDLIGGIDDRLLQRLAHGEMGVDIFDHDGGVVDENADGQRQSAQGHDIDRLSGAVQGDERASGWRAGSRWRR